MRWLQFGLFLLFWALGTWGWANWHHSGLLDSAYRGIQLFLGNFDRPDGPGTALPLQLEAARFLSPLVTIWAVVELVTGKIAALPGALWARISQPEDHVVIGFGEVGEAIALALRQDGEGTRSPRHRRFALIDRFFPVRRRIVLIDRAFPATRRRRARSLGMQPIERDALAFNSPFARWVASIDRAEHIYIAAGTDETNLRIAAALLLDLKKQPEKLWVHLSDFTLLERLRDIDPAAGVQRFPRYFSLYEAAVEKLLVQDAPVTDVMAQGFPATHAVLVGIDRFSRLLIENFALYGGFGPPGFAVPNVTVIDAKAREFLGEVKARHPGIDDWIHLHAIEESATSISWMADSRQIDAVAHVPVTQWIFASDRLPQALALYRGMTLGKHPAARIDVASVFESSHAVVAGAIAAPNLPGLGFFGNLREAAPFSIAINSRLECVAEGFHDYWRKGSGPGYGALSETMRISNWRAALHALLKLRLMKFGGVDPTQPMLGLSEADLNRLRDIVRQPEVENGLGEFEHIRWCVDRILDGWVAGKSRDNRMRVRDQLLYGRGKYHELPKDEANKDRDQIRALHAALMAEHGGPSLAVGFVGHRDLTRLKLGEAGLRKQLIAAASALAGPAYVPLTLVTGVAEGADRLAIAVWHEQFFGPIHGIYPDAQAYDHARASGDHARLDSHEIIPAGTDQPHPELAKRILAQSQHMLALYDGGASGGAGGTADTVDRARTRGIAVTVIPNDSAPAA